MAFDEPIADASGLIALNDISLLNLVEPMLDICLIPPIVAFEITPSVRRPEWITVHGLTKPLDRGIVEAGLDPGESRVLSLALELDAFTVLLDELGARRVAAELGLPVIGVGGVVLRAKEAGIIESVRLNLQRLIDAGFYLSTRLITYALEESGEAET